MGSSFPSGDLTHRVFPLVGELEKALDQLEPLVQTHFLWPGYVKIDPAFAPLRGNPRFERLVAKQ